MISLNIPLSDGGLSKDGDVRIRAEIARILQKPQIFVRRPDTSSRRRLISGNIVR